MLSSGLLRLRIAEGGAHHPSRLRSPIRVLPIELQAIAVGIEEIDALVTAGRVLFQALDRRALVDQALVQLLERGEAAVRLDRDVVETVRLPIGLVGAPGLEQPDVAE